jgi:ATP-binding cassette, subfamily B, bacterial
MRKRGVVGDLVLRMTRRQWALGATIVALVVVGSALGLAPALIGGRIIDSLVARTLGTTTMLVGAMLVATVAAAVVSSTESYLVTLAAERFGRDVRMDIYRHALALPLAFVRGRPPGEMMNRIDGDVDLLVNSLVGTVEPTAASLIALGTSLAIMSAIDWKLTLIAISTIPLWVLAARPAGKRLAVLRREMMSARDAVLSLSGETLGYDGAVALRSHGDRDAEVARFFTVFTRLMRTRLAAAMISRVLQAGLQTLAGLGPALVIVLGALLVVRHQTSIGTLVAFMTLQGRLYGPAGQLANLKVQLSTVRAVFDRVAELLGAPVERSGDAVPAAWDLRVRGAAFALDGRPIVSDVWFDAPAGARVALVGPNGCGKSTLAALLMRLDSPTAGRIEVGGVDLERADLATLRREIVLVPQRSAFFRRTVRENVVLGRAGVTEADLAAALAIADAAALVARLPQGLDTPLDGSLKLSGGELQRLALARAVLRKPKILILDEATSALDERSERAILSALEDALAGVTLLFITHHPEPLERIDRIVSLAPEGASSHRVAAGGLS